QAQGAAAGVDPTAGGCRRCAGPERAPALPAHTHRGAARHVRPNAGPAREGLVLMGEKKKKREKQVAEPVAPKRADVAVLTPGQKAAATRAANKREANRLERAKAE